MIDSLLYLTTFRLGIMYNVCLCARFQSISRKDHLIVVKRIFRYLKGFTNLELCYKGRENYHLKGLYDADYTGDQVKKKNTRGDCHFI